MTIQFPFDPIKRSKEIEALVMKHDQRLYYRFRSSRHYGGVVTADSSGCNLLCAYCWNLARNENPTQGTFHTPAEVIAKLKAVAKRSGYETFRISGAEPILGERSARHLADVLSAFPGRFIVETNGVMLGHNPDLLDLLLPHSPCIRLTIKGESPARFEAITGAEASAFRHQIAAVKELRGRGANYTVAAMLGAVDPIKLIRLFVGQEIEWEEFQRLGSARRNLAKRGVKLYGD